jgi:hypothetical protein
MISSLNSRALQGIGSQVHCTSVSCVVRHRNTHNLHNAREQDSPELVILRRKLRYVLLPIQVLLHSW